MSDTDALQPACLLRSQTKIRIAIADDHPIFRDCLCRLLSLEEDLEVVGQAENGSQLSDILEQCKPDVLLLDLNMPWCGGLAALERLHKANNKTRVLLLTASDNENDYIHALKLGSYGIVQKQTATELLIEGIRHVHAGELWIDPRTTGAVLQRFLSPPPTVVPTSSGRPQGQRRTPLSEREREIVNLVCQGFTNDEIAKTLCISEQTVKNYLHSVFKKLGVTDRLELALYAVQHQIAHVRTEESACVVGA